MEYNIDDYLEWDGTPKVPVDQVPPEFLPVFLSVKVSRHAKAYLPEEPQ